MTEDLLQDLVLYKKSHEKAVSSAARSLISLFREVIYKELLYDFYLYMRLYTSVCYNNVANEIGILDLSFTTCKERPWTTH